jgi:hypothetical protein
LPKQAIQCGNPYIFHKFFICYNLNLTIKMPLIALGKIYADSDRKRNRDFTFYYIDSCGRIFNFLMLVVDFNFLSNLLFVLLLTWYNFMSMKNHYFMIPSIKVIIRYGLSLVNLYHIKSFGLLYNINIIEMNQTEF